MLVFLRHKLTFLAVPKTGTTAVEMALKPHAEIVFAKNRKHITAARYANRIAPFLEETFGSRPEAVAVMREPVEQIRSWYRYRRQPRLDDTPRSTKNISFDQFVTEVIHDDPPERAQIGSQFSFLTNGKGEVMAEHVFSHASAAAFHGFLSDRLKHPVEIAQRNVSPEVDAPLDEGTLARLKKARADDFALYARIMEAGGHLHTPRIA